MNLRAIWSAFLIVAMFVAAPCRAWDIDDTGNDFAENVAATDCMEVMAAEKSDNKTQPDDQHNSKAALACHANCAVATAPITSKVANKFAPLQFTRPATHSGLGQALQPPTPPPRRAAANPHNVTI